MKSCIHFIMQCKMGNKVKTILLIFIFCIFAGAVPKLASADSTVIDYNELISQRDVDTKRSWTIKFNKEVNVNTINANTIKVVDDNNKLVDINIQIAQDRKSIVITPKTDYFQGTNYYVIISKDVQADSKSVMQKDVKMKFTTKNPFKVCLDAGDGGLDTGVIGQGGVKEKDINLAITLKVGKILENNGVQVTYTRKDDNVTWAKGDLIPRFKIATDAKVDYFVSVHCNSSNDNPLATGVEVYYVNGNEKSQDLAKAVDSELVLKTGLADRGAKVGDYPETTNTTIPSIKVYPGFLSTIEDEKKLTTEDFQNKCAEAIASAILKNKINNSATVLTIKEEKKDNYIAHYDEIVNKVYVGMRVNLPQTISVNMSDGTTSKFAVKWEKNNPDTSKPGTYLIKGKLDGFTQDITATIVVLPWTRPKTTIAIDAGHGGYDSGAIGPSGVVENQVTLSIAQKLGKILESKGIGVVYTRMDNNVPKPNGSTYGEYVSRDLQRRCDVSDIAKANYFLSIHCNSNNLDTINGTQTFFCGGSTEGKKLADSIQSELVKAINTNDRKTTYADYYVLKYTKAPAVLTELAFLSNPDEEKLLKTEDFQLKCANAIAEGIVKALQSQ